MFDTKQKCARNSWRATAGTAYLPRCRFTGASWRSPGSRRSLEPPNTRLSCTELGSLLIGFPFWMASDAIVPGVVISSSPSVVLVHFRSIPPPCLDIVDLECSVAPSYSLYAQTPPCSVVYLSLHPFVTRSPFSCAPPGCHATLQLLGKHPVLIVDCPL